MKGFTVLALLASMAIAAPLSKQVRDVANKDGIEAPGSVKLAILKNRDTDEDFEPEAGSTPLAILHRDTEDRQESEDELTPMAILHHKASK